MYVSSMEDGQDFISRLPDGILHHILSFLDMKYVILTSFLSKRWRSVWASLPALSFDKEVFEHDDGPIQELVGLFSLVGKRGELTKELGHVELEDEWDVREVEEAMGWDYDVEESQDEDVENEDVRYEVVEDSEDVRRASFNDFVNAVLLLRRPHGHAIHTFRLSCDDPKAKGDVHRWVRTAVTCNVEVLDLQINDFPDSYLQLPPSVFTSKFLTTLKLDMHWETEVALEVPESVDLPLLKNLHLVSIAIRGGDSMGNFISKCLALETLILSNCTLIGVNTIRISSLKLKELVLYDLDFHQYLSDIPDSESLCKVTVCAPNLTTFRCREYVLNDYTLVELSSLTMADIDMDLESVYHETVNLAVIEFFIHNVVKCLQGLSNVRDLTLSVWLLEAILGVAGGMGMGSLNTLFSNLRYLKLKTNLCGAQEVALMHFLEKCPNIETLVLDMTKGPRTRHLISDEEIYEECNLEQWEEEVLPLWNMSHLKYVEIGEFRGRLTEIEFLKFLLKHAAALEKVLLFIPKKKPQDKIKFRRLMKTIRAYPRASSSVILSCFSSSSAL